MTMNSIAQKLKFLEDNVEGDLYFVTQFFDHVEHQDKELVCSLLLNMFAEHQPHLLDYMVETLKESGYYEERIVS